MNPIEWLDIVNDDDVIVGRAPRDVIHREGHKHRAVHILLSNSQGEWFVQKRSDTKDTNPGLWDTSAAGHVDSGESYRACAIRELNEELGIAVGEAELVSCGRLTPLEETGFEFVEMFRVVSDQSLILEADEIADGRWLDPDALSGWMCSTPHEFTSVFHTVWNIAGPEAPAA